MNKKDTSLDLKDYVAFLFAFFQTVFLPFILFFTIALILILLILRL